MLLQLNHREYLKRQASMTTSRDRTYEEHCAQAFSQPLTLVTQDLNSYPNSSTRQMEQQKDSTRISRDSQVLAFPFGCVAPSKGIASLDTSGPFARPRLDIVVEPIAHEQASPNANNEGNGNFQRDVLPTRRCKTSRNLSFHMQSSCKFLQ